MPNNQDNRYRNNYPNDESVNEAGRNGGEATSNNYENDFYEELGRKGGEARKRLSEVDDNILREAEEENRKRNEADHNSFNN